MRIANNGRKTPRKKRIHLGKGKRNLVDCLNNSQAKPNKKNVSYCLQYNTIWIRITFIYSMRTPMKNKVFVIFSYIIGFALVVWGIFSDFIRGRVFFIGWLQIFLIFLGVIVFICGYLARKSLLRLVCGMIFSQAKKIWLICKPPIQYLVNKDWFIILALLLISLLIIWPKPFNHDMPDEAFYLSLTKNLFYGQGYIYPDQSPVFYRGPVFPLTLSLGLSLFGNSINSTIIMIRIIWLLSIVGIYCLGSGLFNKRVGFFVALFFLLSQVINNEFQYVLSDTLLTFLLIITTLIVWKALNKNGSILIFILGGFILGIAYLTKQTAVILAPLPLFFWLFVRKFRTRKYIGGVLCYLSTFMLFFIGWILYKYIMGAEVSQLTLDFSIGSTILEYFKNAVSTANSPLSTSQSIDRSSSVNQLIQVFYIRDIQQYFSYAILFPASFLFLIYQTFFRKDERLIFLSLCLVFFSALLPSGIVINYGPRHYLYFYSLGIISIVAMLDWICSQIKKPFSTGFFFLLMASLIFFQMKSFKPYGSDFSESYKSQNFFRASEPIVNWINSEIDENANILSVARTSNIFHFLASGNRNIFTVNFCYGEKSYSKVESCTPPYLFIWSHGERTDPNQPRDKLLGVTEESLLSTIFNNDIQYVIIPKQYDFISEYFVKNPAFIYLDDIYGHKVFQVLQTQNIKELYVKNQIPTCLGKGTAEYLKNLIEFHYDKYQQKLKTQYIPWMGLSDTNIQEFAEWQGCTFE